MGLFKKKEVKSYGSIMGAFTVIVNDLKEVVEKEEGNVVTLKQKRDVIDENINNSENEIENCSIAIGNVGNMFPNIG